MLLLSGLFLAPGLWLGLLALKFGTDLLTTVIAAITLKEARRLLPVYPLYVVYFTLNMLALPVYTAFKAPVTWKGRKF